MKMNTDRIKEIQQATAYPESVSVQQALLKVWNETEQEQSNQMNSRKKLYSLDDIHKIIDYMNKNYSGVEDELARLYEDKGEDLPDDFFMSAYNLCLKRAIKSIESSDINELTNLDLCGM